MTKLNWSRARRYQPNDDHQRLERAADQLLRQHGETPAYGAKPQRLINKARKKANYPRPTTSHGEVCIVIGANAPGNKTEERIVRIFSNPAAAHKAGFTWAV